MAPSYNGTMYKEISIFCNIILHIFEYQENKTEIVKVLSSVPAVQLLIENQDRGEEFHSKFNHARLRDYRSMTFDRKIAPLIGSLSPDNMTVIT